MKNKKKFIKFCQGRKLVWFYLRNREILDIRLSFDDLKEFIELLEYDFEKYASLNCWLGKDYISLDLATICYKLGINPDEIKEMKE